VRGLPVRAFLAAASLALAAAPAALADTSDSANWAGYAVHGTGVSFAQVTAQWRQPTARCVPGGATYSAAWIGLGGFNEASRSLEQVGTELDCGIAGRVLSSAWFEVVPAPARTVRLSVRPGDLVAAKVTVSGTEVTVTLSDQTQHRSFTRSMDAPTVDVSSAEWIVEAPSDCISPSSCQLLPLADFGATTFRFAQAVSTAGVHGSITTPVWGVTRIRLRPAVTRFSAFDHPLQGAATPLALTAGGSSFQVVYSRTSGPSAPMLVGREFLPSAAPRAAIH